jgi:hypothetical protein
MFALNSKQRIDIRRLNIDMSVHEKVLLRLNLAE